MATRRFRLALHDGRGLALEQTDCDATHGKRAFMIRMTSAAEAITVEYSYESKRITVVAGHDTLGYNFDNWYNKREDGNRQHFSQWQGEKWQVNEDDGTISPFGCRQLVVGWRQHIQLVPGGDSSQLQLAEPPVAPPVKDGSEMATDFPLSEFYEIASPVELALTVSAVLRINTSNGVYETTVSSASISELQRKLNKDLWSMENTTDPPSSNSSNANQTSSGKSAKGAQEGGIKIAPSEKDETRRPQDRFGPTQAPKTETIEAPAVSVNKGSTKGQGATGISSTKRTMTLDGYEEQVYIDPNRKIEAGQKTVDWDKQKIEKQVLSQRQQSSGKAALERFENSAIGAKLRNTNKVAGERVKEMDHFVAVVETPEVNVSMPTIASLLSVSASGDTAQLIPMFCDDTFGSFTLYVHKRYIDPQTEQVSDPSITAHAILFKRFLEIIFVQLLQQDFAKVRLYYMTTMRHNNSVAHAEGSELHFNVLAFEQQACCELESSKIIGGARPWYYWLQRAATIMELSPTGLYDPGVRKRFKEFTDTNGDSVVI